MVAAADGWALYEDQAAPPLVLPVGSVVRYGQDWGHLRLDHSVSTDQLLIAGRPYRHGLGTHAHSLDSAPPERQWATHGCVWHR